MRPTPRIRLSRPHGLCLAALPVVWPGFAHAQNDAPPVMTQATWIAVIAALILALALARQVRGRRAETARANALAAELDRERALVETAPEAIICWDTGSGEQKLSTAAARILGCTEADPVSADTIAGLAVEDARSELREAVADLIADGTEFHTRFDAPGDKRFELSGRAIIQDGRKPLAVLWIRDDTSAALETTAAQRVGDGLRKLLDSFPFPVWRRGRWLDFEYVNPAYREAVEADADTDPDSVPELAAGSLPDRGRSIAVRAADTRDRQTETHYIVAAGARRLMELTEAPIGADGAIGGFALDRTEIDEVREELARHIESHEQVLHNLGTAIAIFGADRRLEFYNTAYTKLWGLEESFLDTRPSLGEILEQAREARKIPEHANFPEFKAGRNALFTSLIDPIEELVHLPDDKTVRSVIAPHPFGGLLMTWEDVTASLAMERSYNTLIAVQKETLDNLYEAVAVIGGDGRLQLSNPAFGRIWQLTEDELATAPHISEIVERMRDFLDQGNWDDQKPELINLLSDRAGQSGRLERADGSVIDFATVPLPDGAMLLSYVDVSDSHRVEHFLRERNEALETADRLKSEFIANVSYELRTPLNTIIGFSEILTGEYFGDLNDRQSEYSKGILESSQRLLSLINDILDLATIESGQMSLELETVDVYDMMRSVLGLTQERVLRKNLTLDFDCPQDIGLIMADERRLKQALFNILSNSVKFTPDNGEITVSVRRVEDNIIITFTDTGIGIPAEDHDRIFGRFERGHNVEARRSAAGLGLSLVQSFISLHGGDVALESEPGVGTKVVCRLPSRRQEEETPRLAGNG
ncbi:MAG: ATP-binding protein [Alphaproteobacteria bacterium]